MVDDFINLTQGQLLVKYWWVWIVIIFLSAGILYVLNKKKECNHKKKYENYVLTSHPPQIPWTCQKCGEKGADRYSWL